MWLPDDYEMKVLISRWVSESLIPAYKKLYLIAWALRHPFIMLDERFLVEFRCRLNDLGKSIDFADSHIKAIYKAFDSFEARLKNLESQSTVVYKQRTENDSFSKAVQMLTGEVHSIRDRMMQYQSRVEDVIQAHQRCEVPPFIPERGSR